jgi:hypothetical protein
MDKPEQTQEEKMILSHEPVAGYPRVFYVTVALGILYLAYVFWSSWS